MKEKIILTTGHAHAFHHASVLAAAANGYFLAEGLPEVEVRATGKDDLTIECLKSGAIDFGLDPRPHSLLEENAKGAKIYIVAGMVFPWNILCKDLSGIPGHSILPKAPPTSGK